LIKDVSQVPVKRMRVTRWVGVAGATSLMIAVCAGLLAAGQAL
jgi:hypothetical protein